MKRIAIVIFRMLSPQATVGDSVANVGHPVVLQAVGTSPFFHDMSVSLPGRPGSVTSQWVEQHREQTSPIRTSFSASGISPVILDCHVSPTDLYCDEEAARSPPGFRVSAHSSRAGSPPCHYSQMPVGELQRRTLPPAFGALSRAPSRMSSQARLRAPSQLSGLGVAELLLRLVYRQHDDMKEREQPLKAEAVQRKKQLKAEAVQCEQDAKAEASQREQEAVQREKEARAEASQLRIEAHQREQEAKAEALQREKLDLAEKEKEIRNEVEQEARGLYSFARKSRMLTGCVGIWLRRRPECVSSR